MIGGRQQRHRDSDSASTCDKYPHYGWSTVVDTPVAGLELLVAHMELFINHANHMEVPPTLL